MEIFCFGDSHTRYFNKTNMLTWSKILTPTTPKVTAFAYVAGSAKGFAAGQNSRFVYRKFMRDLETFSPEFVCLGFGQVDAEVGYYFRKYVKGHDASAEADLASIYDQYVKMARLTLPDRKLVFKGPNPSTLRIDTQLMLYAFRRLVARITDKGERDRIWNEMEENPPLVEDHAAINVMAGELLKARVEKAGYDFFDIRDAAEDPAAPGLARWDFVPSESDVHLTSSFTISKAYHETLFGIFAAQV